MSDPVERQLAAYNAHDVEAFLACYAPDAVVTDGYGTTLMNGAESIRSGYTAMFAAGPDVRAEVLDRQQAGHWTTDHERVTRGTEVLDVLVAYHVEGNVIRRVIMLR